MSKLAAVLLATGCSVRIPDGKLLCEQDTDCPRGFTCRKHAEDGRCHREGSAVLRDGGDVAAEEAGARGPQDVRDGGAAQGDAGPPSPWRVRGGLRPLGGARSGGPYRLRDEGFEHHRACDEGGQLCISGRIGP